MVLCGKGEELPPGSKPTSIMKRLVLKIFSQRSPFASQPNHRHKCPGCPCVCLILHQPLIPLSEHQPLDESSRISILMILPLKTPKRYHLWVPVASCLLETSRCSSLPPHLRHSHCQIPTYDWHPFCRPCRLHLS